MNNEVIYITTPQRYACLTFQNVEHVRTQARLGRIETIKTGRKYLVVVRDPRLIQLLEQADAAIPQKGGAK